jgi:hypothetical protein
VQVFNLSTLVAWLRSTIDLEKWFIGRGGVAGKAATVFDAHPDWPRTLLRRGPGAAGTGSRSSYVTTRYELRV